MPDLMPNSWLPTTFGAISKYLVNGGTPPTEIVNYWNGSIPWITGADFTASGIQDCRRFVTIEAVRNTSTNVIDKGNLLIVTRTGVGKLAIAPCDIAISQDITGVYPDIDQVDTEFLFYRMRQGAEELTKLNQGTSINGITRKDLTNYPIKLPPLCIQKHIAEILSTVDKAIEQTEAYIAKTEQIKAGLMRDLFTRGVTPVGLLRSPRNETPQLYKESPLGWIPKDWSVRRLDELATVNRGKFSIRPRHNPRYYGGPHPFIQTGDVAIAAGRRISNFSQTLNNWGLAVSRIFPAGTIMVTIAANIADTCILQVPMCAPDSLVGVTPHDGENGRFLQLCISSRKKWLENRAPQTAQKNINLEDIRPLLIPYPEEAEQSEIANLYEAIELEISSSEREAGKMTLLKAGLMTDLLSDHVEIMS